MMIAFGAALFCGLVATTIGIAAWRSNGKRLVLVGASVIAIAASMLIASGGTKWMLFSLGIVLALANLLMVPRLFWRKNRVVVGLAVATIVMTVTSLAVDRSSVGAELLLWLVLASAVMLAATLTWKTVELFRSR